eukprot:scaffold71162_cov73-Phaeocystis_antarctica.AAC.9
MTPRWHHIVSHHIGSHQFALNAGRAASVRTAVRYFSSSDRRPPYVPPLTLRAKTCSHPGWG